MTLLPLKLSCLWLLLLAADQSAPSKYLSAALVVPPLQQQQQGPVMRSREDAPVMNRRHRRAAFQRSTNSAKSLFLKGDDMDPHQRTKSDGGGGGGGGTSTSNRREALSRILRNGSSSVVSVSGLLTVSLLDPPSPAEAAADDESLTSQLFNADGSLRDGAAIETQAKERTVEWQWDVPTSSSSDGDTELAIHIDGSNAEGTSSGSTVRLAYSLPEKWGRGGGGGGGSSSGDPSLYLDRSQGVNLPACRRITVYRAPGRATADRLSKATRVGVAKALDVPTSAAHDFFRDLNRADLIGGRTRRRAGTDDDDEQQTYYEFDMAVAPAACDDKGASDGTNLGLGFCPYESIYLLSAVVVDDRLYVMCVESDKSEWRRASADLRRVRGSFRVQKKV